MNIIYIHQYFSTRSGRTGTRSFEFARYLSTRGHRITIITSGLHNAQFPAHNGKRFTCFEADGLRVISVRAGYNDPHYGTTLSGSRRTLSFFIFCIEAYRIARKFADTDLIFATHTPLTVGLTGIWLSKRFRTPFIFEVRDLWPEALVNTGALKNPVLAKLMGALANYIYHHSDHIVALSPGIKDGVLSYGIDPGIISVIPNGCDLDLFSPSVNGRPARVRLGLGDRFTVTYFGAMGFANGLDYVLEAARILLIRERRDIVILLHGDGGARAELERKVARDGLSNVLFSSLVPDKEEVSRIVAASDVCLTIYRATKEQSWSPNKLFDSLAAGKPVIINVDGWLRSLVVEGDCGYFADPERPSSLADAIENLQADPPRLRKMGNNAREIAEKSFDRAALASQLEEVIMSTHSRYSGLRAEH